MKAFSSYVFYTKLQFRQSHESEIIEAYFFCL